MILFWLTCVSLVLGGGLALLRYDERLHGLWRRKARVRVRKHQPVSRHVSEPVKPLPGLPPFRTRYGVITRAGPQNPPPA